MGKLSAKVFLADFNRDSFFFQKKSTLSKQKQNQKHITHTGNSQFKKIKDNKRDLCIVNWCHMYMNINCAVYLLRVPNLIYRLQHFKLHIYHMYNTYGH